MKVINMVSASLLLAGLAYSGTSMAAHSDNGVYASLGAGISNLNVHGDYRLTMATPAFSVSKHYGIHKSISPNVLHVGLGYGHLFSKHFYGAVEFNYQYKAHAQTYATDITTYDSTGYQWESVEHTAFKNQLDADLLGGYHFEQGTLVYGKVGYSALRMDEQGTITQTSPEGVAHILPFSHAKTLNGALFGVGVRFPMGKHFRFGLEYDYTLYPKSTSHASIQSNIPVVTPTLASDHTLNTNTVMTSIIYTF